MLTTIKQDTSEMKVISNVSDERMWLLLSAAVHPHEEYYKTVRKGGYTTAVDFDINVPGLAIHHQAAAWPFPQLVIVRRPGRRPRMYVGRWRNF